MNEKISIEWTDQDLQEYEAVFLEELEYIKGYILQAIQWLIPKPTDREHIVSIWLLLPEEIEIKGETFDLEDLIPGDFFIEIIVEPNRNLTVNLHQKIMYDSDEGFKFDEKAVGYVTIPPFNSFTLDQRQKLSEALHAFFRGSELDPDSFSV